MAQELKEVIWRTGFGRKNFEKGKPPITYEFLRSVLIKFYRNG